MKASEAVAVLTAAALVDKRTIGEADSRMWADILPDNLGPRVAIEAVKAYYAEHREMIMPADVITYAATARRNLSRNRPLDVDAFRDLPSAGHRHLYSREFYEALAAGASSEDANRLAASRASKSSEAERLALEPPPKPASYYQEW